MAIINISVDNGNFYDLYVRSLILNEISVLRVSVETYSDK